MRARRLLKWTLVALCVIAAIALFRPFMLAFGPSIYATVIPLLDPRVVIARNFGAGSVTHNITPVTVTLHEYARNRAHMTTGRSISFRLPKAYSFSSGNQAGGPQYGIHISYHKFTEEPFAFTLQDGAGFRRKNLDGATVRRSRIGVSVSTRQYRAPNVSLAEILKSGRIFYWQDGGKQRRLLDTQYCGFDRFESDEPWPHRYNENREVIPVQPFQIPPFNETRLFARRTPAGNYDTFVSCSPSLTPDYAGCGATVDFEGWETTIRFSGEHLCDYDAAVDQARNFLSRHVVQRTPRRQE